MPIGTNLNQSPYWDDFSPLKKYYQILFQPGVSVQARELNALQSMFQHQLESFGDNIFSSGTIVSGCNFQFLNPYPYIQLNDIDQFNNTVIPSQYVGFNIENQLNGLQATILNFANGFQTTPPNLKTLYVKYLNTGNTGANIVSFSAGDVLTIFDPFNPVQQVNISGGGIGFSNTDNLVILSSVICTVTGGTPTVGNYINNGNGLTNVQIISVTNLNVANQYVIGVAPRTADLANAQCNSQFWTFSIGDNITNIGATMTMTVNEIVGSGAQGNVITNGVGTIIQVPLSNHGVGYQYTPFVTVQSANNLSGYNTLTLVAQDFLTQITVASGANTVGNGYAFGVTQGVVYQKGIFLDVDPQVILVSKYDQNPDNVAVCFTTSEQIIDYNIDPSLLDNANGTLNFQAPGADRLKLVPQLQVVSVANLTSNSVQPIVQWKAGQPFQQSQQTIYSLIGNEMAQRTEDAEGDFVIDPFVVTTQDPLTTNQIGEYFNIVIDPGTAYISGFKVATSADFNINDTKGINSTIVNNHTVSLNYGNYLIVNSVGGAWPFNTGATVSLYDTAKSFNGGSNLNPAGNLLGTANMRSMLLYQGPPGQSSTQYLLYLFNVQMNSGANFANVASVAYNPSGVNTAIADVVLLPNNLGVNAAILQQSNADQLVFWSGVNSLKNANNVIYTYRTVNTSLSTANGNASNATITIDISSGSETFPYGSGALSQLQLQDFYVVPTGGDMLYTTAVAGTVVANASANTIVANTGTAFAANLTVGDWVYVSANSTGGHDLRQITAISNNTFLALASAPSFSNGVATLTRVFPQNVPVPFGFRPRLTGSVNTNENIVTLQFGQPFTFSGTTATTVAFNIERSNNPAQLTKTANRNRFVEFCTSNNVGGQTGPWSLGVPDVFRLRGVYIGNSSVSNSGTNYISSFFVDSKQDANFYGLSALYLRQGASVPLTSNSYILVQFDYFTSSGVGYYDTVSYLQTSVANTIFTQDSLPLANLTTFCNSWEVPEVFLDDGTEVDLLEYIDFRPYCANTVAPSTNVASAPLNPANTFTLSTTGEKKFPLPSSSFIATIEGWIGRIDSVLVDKNGNFIVNQGNPGANLQLCVPPVQPNDTLKIVDVGIPPYPNLPINPSTTTSQILKTNVVSNQKLVTTRQNSHRVYNYAANSVIPFNQPSVYTMADIGRMDRQLKQLQYEVTLNALEANTLAMAIPSSVNPAENRTSYGIFVDDFASSQFSALNDPEYAAIKQGTNIVPPKVEWDVQLFGRAGPPYIQFPIVQQDQATVGGITDPLGLGPICAINLGNTVAYTQLFRNIGDIELSNNPASNADIVTVQMAEQATIFDNISNTNLTITQWLATHQYDPYTATINNPLGLNQGVIDLGNILASLGFSGESAKGFIGAPTLGFKPPPAFSYDYNAATQQLIIFTAIHPNNIADTNIPNTLVINNIPQALADTFAQAFLGQITWQQFFASLNITGTAPSGGQVVDTNYLPPVVFYFYNYSQGVKFNIYQGTTLVASSDPGQGVPSCQNLNINDTALLTGPAAQFWFNDHTDLYMQPFQQLAGGYVSYAGKIAFNYNPKNGSQFTIKTQMSPASLNWRWVMAYPIDGASVGCVPANRNIDASEIFTPVFSTFSANSFCGNGAENSGQISILTGFTATWNSPNPTPTTSIVPFDETADWKDAQLKIPL